MFHGAVMSGSFPENPMPSQARTAVDSHPSTRDLAYKPSTRKSRKRIKSYLHKEYATNKFLSVNDYKEMTKQVMELRSLEHSYINEESQIPRPPRIDPGHF